MKFRNKIIGLAVMICMISLLSISITGYITVQRIANYSADSNISLGGEASAGAEYALTEQAHHFLNIIAQQQARNIDSMLSTLKSEVDLFAGVVSDILSNPEYYAQRRHIIHSSEVTIGTFVSAYSLADRFPMTEEIQREIDLLSNLSLFTSSLVKNENIVDVFVGTESGLFYMYTPELYDLSDFDPRVRPWYLLAAANSGETILTDVYECAAGLGLIITIAKAVYDDAGEFRGVAAMDVLLQSMTNLVLETRIMETGYAFIINHEGAYIVHPNMGEEGFEPYVSLGYGIGAAEGYRRMMDGETGFVRVESPDNPFFMAFSPAAVAGWSIGAIVYEAEMLSVLETLSGQIDALMDEAGRGIVSMTDQAVIAFISIAAAVAVMVIILAIVLTFIISRPIQKLTEEVIKIGEGNLEKRIEGVYNDELDKIKDAVNSMAADIKANMGMLSGIEYASKIQRTLLPPDGYFSEAFADYSIIWEPKDIVSGDIYWIRNFKGGTVLCVCDCTGHGTPGALLTMLVVTTFRTIVNESNFTDPAAIIWELEKRFLATLSVAGKDIRDGCDLAVAFIADDGTVKISAGNTNVFFCDGKKVTRLRGQKLRVGDGAIDSKDRINVVTVPADTNNKFYIASDGLYDQVGGDEKIPFGYDVFEKIILEYHDESQSAISGKIWAAFEEYRGGNARRDDFELISFKPKTERGSYNDV